MKLYVKLILSICSLFCVISSTSATPVSVRESKHLSAIGDIFDNLKNLKKDVLNFIIKPSKQPEHPKIPFQYPSYEITTEKQVNHSPASAVLFVSSLPTFGQFSAYPGFVVPTTEGPGEQKNEDLIDGGLYREDVLKKPLHNKKTRKTSNSSNNSII